MLSICQNSQHVEQSFSWGLQLGSAASTGRGRISASKETVSSCRMEPEPGELVPQPGRKETEWVGEHWEVLKEYNKTLCLSSPWLLQPVCSWDKFSTGGRGSVSSPSLLPF